MVSLSNPGPAVLLGGMFIAGQSSRDVVGNVSGRDLTAGFTGKQLAIGGWGNASAPWIGNRLKSVPLVEADMSNSLAQAAAAAGLSLAGRSSGSDVSTITNPLAGGILFNAAGEAFKEMNADAGSLIGGIDIQQQRSSGVSSQRHRKRRAGMHRGGRGAAATGGGDFIDY